MVVDSVGGSDQCIKKPVELDQPDNELTVFSKEAGHPSDSIAISDGSTATSARNIKSSTSFDIGEQSSIQKLLIKQDQSCSA